MDISFVVMFAQIRKKVPIELMLAISEKHYVVPK